jgi:hypothetical protein
MSLRLIFGVHNHQPVGNFDHVIAEVFALAYQPFLERLEANRHVRLCMHHTGPLWEWLARHRPEYLSRLAALVQAGRVEILGGAFYESILPMIPEADRRGQIQLMSEAVRERFGKEVRGMWLAERVWEPQLVSSLAAAGIAYVLLDDYHFVQAGIDPADLTSGPLLTDELGATVALFPISEKLRYLIPFREPEETVALCRDLHERDPGGVLVMVDDGEKFGSWPETHDWVYKQGWLERFFKALARESDWLELATPSEVLAARPPRRCVYLPPGSYFEMTEWALPVPAAERFTDLVAEARDENRWDRLRPFLRGGFWRQFLQRYSESARMYHRGLLLHADIAATAQPEDRCATARRELWQAQCNDAYWHGVFGGLYLPHMRQAVWEHLIRGTAALVDVPPRGRVQAVAVNGDATWDLRLGDDRLDLFLAPARGASLVGLEDRGAAWNLQNILTRRREAYHRKLEQAAPESAVKADDEHESIHDRPPAVTDELRRALAVDSYERASLLDRLLHADAPFAETLNAMAAADGGDFAGATYDLVVPARSLLRDGGGLRGWVDDGAPRIVCARSGRYRDRAGRCVPLHLRKELVLEPGQGSFRAAWHLRNEGQEATRLRFASEWNLALLQGQTYLATGSKETPLAVGRLERRRELSLRVAHFDAHLRWLCGEPAEVWVHEVQTVSQAESGLELNYQGHMILFVWTIALDPGAECPLSLTFNILR